MQCEYHSQALERGIYVIGSCGFDSIPADLGVLYTERQLKGIDNHTHTHKHMHTQTHTRYDVLFPAKRTWVRTPISTVYLQASLINMPSPYLFPDDGASHCRSLWIRVAAKMVVDRTK